MGFPEDLSRHAEQIIARTPHIRGEEATKHALVVPFIQLLGYDVFDPREVQPEYTADFATKTRGQLEKIDYAIWKDGKAAIFVECKATTAELADHDGQLSRYFNATPSARVGV
jgi:predicted type IV restriction endonuclease